MDLLHTRSELKKAFAELRAKFDDGEIDERDWFDKSLAILQRAKEVAADERARSEVPQGRADEVMSILNSMCEPPAVPLEDEIVRALVQVRKLRDQLR